MNHTAKIRVKVVGSGTREDPFRVDLPSYNMVPDSWQPIIAGRVDKNGVLAKDEKGKPIVLTPAEKAELSCMVVVPEEICDDKGQPSKAKIRALYKGQPRWDRDDVLDDV